MKNILPKRIHGARLPLVLVIFLDMLGFTLVIPILAPLLISNNVFFAPTTDYAVRTIVLGILLSIYAVAQFFGAPILGALSDRYGRKWLLVATLAGNCLGYIAFAIGVMMGHLWLLFVGRAFQGFTGGNMSIALSAMADVSDEKQKASNFGLIGTAMGLGFIIGPYIGGKLADPTLVPWFTFATPIWFAAGFALLTVIVSMVFFPETCTERRHTPVSALTGFRNIKKAWYLPNLRVMFVVMFLLILGFNFVTQFFQVFLIQKWNFNQSQIGDMFAYAGIWIAISQVVFTTPLSKKFKPQAVLPYFVLLSAAAMVALVFPESAMAMFWIVPFVIIGQGVTQPNAIALVSNLSDKDSQGEILGINQSIQSLGMAIPPAVAGAVVLFNRNTPILFGAGLTFLAGIVFILFYRFEKEKLFHEI